jgi:hypothetical protein
VQVRNVTGGPAREQTSAALERAGAGQQQIEAWITSAEASLDAARTAVTRNP